MSCKDVVCGKHLFDVIEEHLPDGSKWVEDDGVFLLDPYLGGGYITLGNDGAVIDLVVDEKAYDEIIKILDGKLRYKFEDGALNVEIDFAPVECIDCYCYSKDDVKTLAAAISKAIELSKAEP